MGVSYAWMIGASSGSRVPGEIKSTEQGGGSGPSAQKRLWAGRWSWAAKVGLLSLQVVPQQQCNGHCLCDSAQARQLKQNLRSAQVTGQWQGDTALTLPLFWRWFTVSLVFFRRYPRLSLHSFIPSPPVPVPNKHPHFCGGKAKWSGLVERLSREHPCWGC